MSLSSNLFPTSSPSQLASIELFPHVLIKLIASFSLLLLHIYAYTCVLVCIYINTHVQFAESVFVGGVWSKG